MRRHTFDAEGDPAESAGHPDPPSEILAVINALVGEDPIGRAQLDRPRSILPIAPVRPLPRTRPLRPGQPWRGEGPLPRVRARRHGTPCPPPLGPAPLRRVGAVAQGPETCRMRVKR